MKKLILSGLLLSGGLFTNVVAQTPTQNMFNGVHSTTKQTTGSMEGMKRQGSGKMASGVSRNGNTNLSPTSPSNTQGSTSDGTGSAASAGGAAGTGVKEMRQRNSEQTSRSSVGPNETTTQDGLNGKGKAQAIPNQISTSGKDGSRQPTTQSQVTRESRTNDKMVGTPNPKSTGPGAPGTPGGF